jgi:hypothetical protein
MFCDLSSQLSGVPGSSSTLCGTLNNSWWKAIDTWSTGNVEPYYSNYFVSLVFFSFFFFFLMFGSRNEDLEMSD